MEISNKPDIREKAIKYGMDYPLDEELVMLILGSGNKNMPVAEMSRKIVDVMDSCDWNVTVENLMRVKGIGKGKALAVAAAMELGKRRSVHFGAHINSPRDIVPYIQNYAISKKEHFVSITLNGGHDIIEIHVVSVGTVNKSLVHPREVFGPAIKENAAAIILCHNHPSGNSDPSKEDIETTKKMLAAAEILGITVLDHIIISCEKYFSFLEHELLFTQEE